MKDLTQIDFKLATKIVDEIVDNTDVPQIKERIEKAIEDYEENKKRQFLVLLNGLFGNVMMNELDYRCDEAYDRSLEARSVTKQLNGR